MACPYVGSPAKTITTLLLLLPPVFLQHLQQFLVGQCVQIGDVKVLQTNNLHSAAAKKLKNHLVDTRLFVNDFTYLRFAIFIKNDNTSLCMWHIIQLKTWCVT